MSKLSDARKKIQALNLTPETEQAFEVILEFCFLMKKQKKTSKKKKLLKKKKNAEKNWQKKKN